MTNTLINPPPRDRCCFSGLNLGLNNIRDTEGRPLGEGRARTDIKAHTPMEMTRCPYKGSRSGMPMNRSALRQMTDRWPELLEALKSASLYIAQRHSQQHLQTFSPSETVYQQWVRVFEVSAALAVLPGALVYQTSVPLGDREIPVRIAALFKIAVGVEGLLYAAVLNPPSEPISARLLCSMAEEQSRLHADGEACAGPLRYIEEALEYLLMGIRDGVDGRIQEHGGDVTAAATHNVLSACSTGTRHDVSRYERSKVSDFTGPEFAAQWQRALDVGAYQAHFKLLRAALGAYAKAQLPILLNETVAAFENDIVANTDAPALEDLPFGSRVLDYQKLLYNRPPTPLQTVERLLNAARMPPLHELEYAEHAHTTETCISFMQTCLQGLAWPQPIVIILAPLTLKMLAPVLALLFELQAVETKIWQALGENRAPAPLRLNDQHACGDLEFLAWLQAIVGCQIILKPGSQTVEFRMKNKKVRLDICSRRPFL